MRCDLIALQATITQNDKFLFFFFFSCDPHYPDQLSKAKQTALNTTYPF